MGSNQANRLVDNALVEIEALAEQLIPAPAKRCSMSLSGISGTDFYFKVSLMQPDPAIADSLKVQLE